MRIPNVVLDELAKDESLGVIERGLYLLALAHDPESVIELARVAKMDRCAAARACRKLVTRGWMKMVASKGRKRPAALIPRACQIVMAHDLEAEYDLVINKGEFLVNKRLDWLLRNDEYVRNARPKFLKNPESDEPLEYDRFDPKEAFATEFNGTQHYKASQKYKDDKVREQQAHDMFKESLSVRNGVTLLTLASEDLRPGVLEAKLDQVVPHLKRGYVDRDGPYIKTLNRICDNYASKVERAEQEASQASRALQALQASQEGTSQQWG